MASKIVEILETQVRVPLWLFILVGSSLGYDTIKAVGLIGG